MPWRSCQKQPTGDNGGLQSRDWWADASPHSSIGFAISQAWLQGRSVLHRVSSHYSSCFRLPNHQFISSVDRYCLSLATFLQFYFLDLWLTVLPRRGAWFTSTGILSIDSSNSMNPDGTSGRLRQFKSFRLVSQMVFSEELQIEIIPSQIMLCGLSLDVTSQLICHPIHTVSYVYSRSKNII